LVKSTKKQTAEKEIIVSEHPVERYIRLNKLKNDGINRASGKYIWMCNADFVLDDETFLQRMVDRVEQDNLEAILPMYKSPAYGKYKVADGAEFIRREALDRFMPFNEEHIGISGATMFFLDWIVQNLRWHASKEFVIILDHSNHKRVNKVHDPTRDKCKGALERVAQYFTDRNLWMID